MNILKKLTCAIKIMATAIFGSEKIEQSKPQKERLFYSDVEILEKFDEKITALKRAALWHFDGSERPSFECVFIKTLMNFYNYVGPLPASETDHHSGRYGLFEHSFEVALMCVTEESRTCLLSRNYTNPAERRERKSRIVLAIWICGLLHDIGKIYSDIRVFTNDGHNVWHPLVQNIDDWSYSIESEVHYEFKSRKHGAHSAYNLLFLKSILSKEALDYLSSTPDLVTEIITCFQFVREKDKTQIQGLFSPIVNYCDVYSSKKNKRVSFDDDGNKRINSIGKQIKDCVMQLSLKCDPLIFLNIADEVFVQYDNFLIKIRGYLEQKNIGDKIIIEQLSQLGFIDNDEGAHRYYWFYEGISCEEDVKSLLKNDSGYSKLKVIRVVQNIGDSNEFEHLKEKVGLLRLNKQFDFRILTHNGIGNHLITGKDGFIGDAPTKIEMSHTKNTSRCATSESDIVDHIYVNYLMFEDAKAITKIDELIVITDKAILTKCLIALFIYSPLKNVSKISESEVSDVVQSLPTILS